MVVVDALKRFQQDGHIFGCKFLLTVGSFLLTAELLTYSCVLELFCLQLVLFCAYSWSFFF